MLSVVSFPLRLPTHDDPVIKSLLSLRSYFLHTTNGGSLANVCASLISTDLTNVWSRTSLAPGPMPNNHPLTTIKKADITSNTVWADVIQVRWKSDNPKILSLLAQQTATSRSSSLSATGSVSPSLTSSTIAQPTTTPTHRNRNNGGLSTGAEAGIGIGVALCAVIIAVAAFLFFRNRRRKSKAAQVTAASAKEGEKPLGDHGMEQHGAGPLPPAELDSGNIGELAGSEARAELGHR